MGSLQELFDTVIDLPPNEQIAYLDTHCPDPETRDHLERLIRYDRDNAERFGMSPVPAIVAGSSAGPSVRCDRPDSGLIGRTLDQRYRVQEVIGEGGMGVVYRAEQTSPVVRDVAIKVLKPGTDTQRVIDRFEAERQALARMSHPGIAQVFDAGAIDGGRPYFVMELVRGESIANHCSTHGLSTDARLGLLLQVCEAVQHAHARGVIHRDLKPANVLIEQASNRPIIIDFGVAKAVGEALTPHAAHTEHGQLIGTPEFMSPEQADLLGADADTRTDVYAVGAILYRVLTGCTPFDAEVLQKGGYAEMLRIIREVDPPRMSTRVEHRPALAARLSGDLDWIAATAMAKDRDQRYQSVAECAEDLRRHLRQEPVRARPPSIRYLAGRFVRRNRFQVFASVALALALLGGIGATSWFAIREARLRDEAQGHAEKASRAAARSESVNLFLGGMLSQARELGSNGLNVTMGEVLAATAERLDNGELADHPGVEIEVREIIAQSYHELGWPGLSAPHAGWVVDHADAIFGADSERTIEALWLYGEVLKESQQLDRALDVFQRFYERSASVLGPDDTRTWHALDEIGNTLFRLGDTVGAQRTLRRALHEMQRLEGDASWRTALCMFNLGGTFRQQGEWDRAYDLYTRALAVFDRSGGLAVTSAGRIRAELALHILPGLGRIEESREYMHAALRNARRGLGPDHGETANLYRLKAFVDLKVGHREDAFAAMRWYIDHCKRIFGDNSMELAAAHFHASRLHILAGDDGTAIREARAALAIFDDPILLAESSESPDLMTYIERVQVMTECVLAQSLLNRSNPAEARVYARSAITRASAHPQSHGHYAVEAERLFLASIIASELGTGRDGGLETELRSLLSRAELVHGPDSAPAARTRHTLARWLANSGREDQAEAHFAGAAPVLAAQSERFRPLPPVDREVPFGAGTSSRMQR